ncbi:MAG TPA: carbohydrate binding domain-containing protein [Capsulimonadaceae bacterium]|jgi:hypothetical protein
MITISRLLAGATLAASLLNISASVFADTPAPVQMLKNPGLEGTYNPVTPSPTTKSLITGVLPAAWQDGSDWADVDIAYSELTTDVHEGKSALKVEYTAKRAGVCQMFQYIPKIIQGHTYTLTVWLQGNRKVPIDVYLRRTTAPYTEYGKAVVVPGIPWEKVTVKATATDTIDACFMIRPAAPVTFYVDDASMTDDGPAK